MKSDSGTDYVIILLIACNVLDFVYLIHTPQPAMVRFKNRHILVEFLQPSNLESSLGAASSTAQSTQVENEAGDDDEEVLQRIPEIPFMLPLPPSEGTRPKNSISDEAGGAIYKAVRTIVQEVYGDEGWGRIASSFKGKSKSREGNWDDIDVQ